MNKILTKMKKFFKHVRKNKHHYLLGTFGSFAIVKMVLLFAGFFGLMQITNTFAAGALNSGNVTQAPYNCSTGATTCDLSFQGITSIAPDTFINHTSLQQLYLYSNSITSLESGAFNGLSSLTYLGLAYNQITGIESGDFNGLDSLTTLRLDSNQISSLESGDFLLLSTVTTLNLMSNLITSLESGDFNGLDSLTSLDLQSNQITGIENSDFSGLPSLTDLNLYDNDIASLESGAFLGLSNLINLYLDSNQITSIESDTFSGLDSLITLILQFNQISSFESGAFNGLPSLVDLYLNDNQITYVPDSFFGLTTLVGGNITNNCLIINDPSVLQGFLTGHNIIYDPQNAGCGGTITRNFDANMCSGMVSDIPEIECLALVSLFNSTDGYNRTNRDNRGATGIVCSTRNGVTCDGGHVSNISLGSNNLSGFIPAEISDLSYLTDLYLNNNQISSIESGAFNGLGSLTGLFLHYNQLTGIEIGTFDGLSVLNELSLYSNQITSIESGDFNGLDGLNKLYLYSNQISSIESGSFNGLGNLTDLFLQYNELTGIDNGYFNGLPNLTSLDVSYNQISSLENGDFLGLSSLTALNLMFNRIISIESNTFNGLSDLIALYLQANQISSIGSNTFSGLSSLTGLGLSLNQITSIETDAFNGLDSLITLNLQSNQISSIENGDFNGLSVLTILNLRLNRITSIELDDFSGLSNLVTLDIRSNQITSIESGTFLSGNGFSHLNTLTFNPNCSTIGITLIPFNVSSNTFTTNTNCALITGTDADGFITNLESRSYVLSDDYYVGDKAISFNYPGTANQFLAPVIMQSTNPNGYTQDYYQNIVQVQYESGTTITYGGQPFTGVLHNPILFATGVVQGLTNVSAVIRFGYLLDNVDFSQPITIRMPAPGKNIDDIVFIYSSDQEDIYGPSGPAWNLEKTATVIDIGGNPYVEFTGTHASRWAVGGFSGTFVINNDDATTTSDSVTLNISGTGIQNMRFQNDSTGGARSARETYATSTGRTLSTGYGTKTVYAEFDVDGDNVGDVITSDTIEYLSGGGGGGTGGTGGGNITGNIRLDITTSSGSCTYGTSLYLGSHAVQFAAFDMTGSEFPQTFECVDTEGLANRTMTMQASGDLTNGSQTISKSNVSMIANTNYVSAGSCTAGANQITWTSIGASPATILNKASSWGQICTITATGVNLAVHIPSNQAVGTYTGTLSLDMPF